MTEKFKHIGCTSCSKPAVSTTTKDSVKDAEAARDAMQEHFRRSGVATIDSLVMINRKNRQAWSKQGGTAA